MEWLRLVSILVGLLISIPAFFLSNLVRLCRIGRRLFHVRPRFAPPACLMDPRYGQHKFITANGVRLHYVESGDPGKPLLLFVHGWPQFWFAWRYQIEHFQKVGGEVHNKCLKNNQTMVQNYHVVAMDMRGFNDSDKPEGIDNYFIMNMVEDIRALVTGLGEKR